MDADYECTDCAQGFHADCRDPECGCGRTHPDGFDEPLEREYQVAA